MQTKKTLVKYISLFSLTVIIICPFQVFANAFSDTHWKQPINDLGDDDKLGTIYVHGTLTESACRLSMDSAYQVVDLGNTSTSQLQYVGDKGHPVSFDINLLDCVRHNTNMDDFHTGQITHSLIQPAVKARFLAPTAKNNSSIIAVTGAKGFGLQITNSQGKVAPIGVDLSPQLLTLNNDSLMYYITPIRTTASLEAGQYYAVINFELIYD